MSIKYRFKTLEELEEEYGLDWRNCLTVGWAEDMEVLYGLPFEKEHDFTWDNICRSYPDPHGNHWSISKQMLIPIDKKVSQELLALLERRNLIRSKITVNKLSNCTKLTYKADYGFSISVYPEPTGNCQLLSVAYFNHILQHFSKNDDVKEFLLAAVPLAKYAKRLIFVDTYDGYFERMQKLCYTPVTKYTSTNGSNMCFGLIKI